MSLILSSLDNDIQEKSLLKHKFYQMWSAGSLSIDNLRGYSREYFQLVKAVPFLVNNVQLNVTPELDRNYSPRPKIKHNLEEEKEHIAPWISFADSIGVTQNELYEYECSEKTQEAVAEMLRLTNESFAAGISMLYTYEKQLPEISTKKIEGLVKFYGVQSNRALDYFRIHEKVDMEHAKLWGSLIDSMPASQHSTIRDAASVSLKCQNMILDGVCDMYLSNVN
ncbi:MAG TPA: iron-containing redox enzyme family protein [Nitrososphaeraceae archaeon]|nr:iron-containing redox enzyme family protein [Nitrososphaeraceae archaeon]